MDKIDFSQKFTFFVDKTVVDKTVIQKKVDKTGSPYVMTYGGISYAAYEVINMIHTSIT